MSTKIEKAKFAEHVLPEYIEYTVNDKIEFDIESKHIKKNIEMDHDVFKITHIVFDNDLIYLSNNDYIIIYSDDNILYKANLIFLAKFELVKKVNNEYVLPVDIKRIISAMIQNCKISVKIIINDKFKKVKLLIDKSYIKNKLRQNLCDRWIEEFYIYPYSIFDNTMVTDINFILNCTINTDGYYIETNISNIKNISIDILSISDSKITKFINYDTGMIDTCCKKINENMLFVPLDIFKINDLDLIVNNLFSLKTDKFTNQSFIIKISLQKPEKINLHTPTYRVMRYSNGILNPTLFDNLNKMDSHYSKHEYLEGYYNFFKMDNLNLSQRTIFVTNDNSILKKINLNNAYGLTQLKFKNPSINLLNLPIDLIKLEVQKREFDIQIKVPFGCEYNETNE